jgi:nitrogen regulatory protein PII
MNNLRWARTSEKSDDHGRVVGRRVRGHHIDTILRAARSTEAVSIGDGKIFVTELLVRVRISDGERGGGAI